MKWRETREPGELGSEGKGPGEEGRRQAGPTSQVALRCRAGNPGYFFPEEPVRTLRQRLEGHRPAGGLKLCATL